MRFAVAAPVAAVAVLAIALLIGGDGVRIVDDLIVLGLAIYSTGCAVLAARRVDGGLRRAWRTLALASGALAVGDAVWVLSDVLIGRHPPVPSPADLCYLAFPVLATVGMAQLPIAWIRQSRLRLILDAAIVALCLFLLAWILAFNDIYDQYRADKVALSVAILYPPLDLVALTVAIVVLVRVDARQRRVASLLTTSIGLTTLADTALAYLFATGRYESGGFLDVVWAAALATFAVAALLVEWEPASHLPVVSSVPSNASLWLPYVPLLLAGTVGPPLVMYGLERLLVPLVVVAVCLRQAVAAWENRELLTAAAHQALRDPLTGLANRALFHDRLTHAMMLRSREERAVAVVSLDLDDFKLVNDSLGHPVADDLLIRVGQRLSECIRPGDTVARFGGDEFALLLEGDVDESHLVAQRIVDAFREPFTVEGEGVLMRPSIGVAVTAPDEPELAPDELVKRADIAMYTAKRSRSREVHTFHSEMMLIDPDVVDIVDGSSRPSSAGTAQVRLLGELRNAIDHRQLAVVYQPKLALDSGTIVGVEALLRWPHPQLGTLRPDAFMSLVRQHGLMRPVTDFVLDAVLDDAARWCALGTPIPVAVNLFAPFLRDPELPDTLIAALAARGLAAHLLTVEITEDLVLSEIVLVTAVLQRLRDHGIKVAIDDFGSGYSALSYLRDLPIDEVKLDRHFIASVTTDTRAAAVVRAVIDLNHELGITVVAEGVEDADTARWLRQHGCDIGQGYHFGRPVPADRIAASVGAAAGSPQLPL